MSENKLKVKTQYIRGQFTIIFSKNFIAKVHLKVVLTASLVKFEIRGGLLRSQIWEC